MKHSDKIKMARKMITRVERLGGVGLFNSMAWKKRSAHRLIREIFKMNKKYAKEN